MSELEKEILEIINCEIEGEYIGKLKVKEEEYWRNYPCDQNPCKKGVVVNIEYSLELYLNSDYEPIVMSYMSPTRQYNYKKWSKTDGWEPLDKYKKQARSTFKEFIKEEFKNRMLQQVDYYKISLELPSLNCNEQRERDRKN